MTPSSLTTRFQSFLTQDISRREDLILRIEQTTAYGDELSRAYRQCYNQHSCNTADADVSAQLAYRDDELMPLIQQQTHELHRYLLSSSALESLPPQLMPSINVIRVSSSLFRAESLPLTVRESQLAKDYMTIRSQQMVAYEGQMLTMQQASNYLESPDREVRERMYRAITQRRYDDAPAFDQILDELIQTRHQIALNAGYTNFRDYQHDNLTRLDYRPEDCLVLHDLVATYITPLRGQLQSLKKQHHGLDSLKPRDTAVDVRGLQAIPGFFSIQEMKQAVTTGLHAIHPTLGEILEDLEHHGLLDLETRQHKASGGYNVSYDGTADSFIFCNGTGSFDDFITLAHEAGHAAHHALSARHTQYSITRHPPLELAELASTTAELLILSHLDHTHIDAQQALRTQMVDAIDGLCRTCLIDAFQHRLYTHPSHTQVERSVAFIRLYHRFYGTIIDRSDLPHVLETLWHKQLHLFESPFYYIEYAFAQIGALRIWQQYLDDPEQTIHNYLRMLSLGYTKPLRELYQIAGTSFGCDEAEMKGLVVMLREMMNVS